MPDSALLLSLLFNGVVLGFIYLLLVMGLTIIFGMLNVVNFAHGSFYAVGAYVAYTVMSQLGFVAALIVVPLLVALIGVAAEMGLVRRLYKVGHVPQILLTYGLMLVLQETISIIWGLTGKSVSSPELLAGAVDLGFITYPRYRLFVIVTAALVSVAVWLFLVRTKYGAIMRAGIEDSEMVSCLGINVARVFTVAFALGVALAGLAGVLVVPIRGAEPTMGIDILVLSFVIVVIGGLGSFGGAVLGAFLIGITQSVMAQVWPAGSNVIIFALMALVLLLRPQGLLGSRA